MRDGAALATALATTGVDVLLAIDRPTFNNAGGTATLRAISGLINNGSVTAMLMDPHAKDGEAPPSAELDTRIVLSLDQLALGVVPALDPAHSRSGFHDDPTAERLRVIWAKSNELRRFIAQPMYVATEYSGEPGVWVEPSDAEASLEQLARA